MSWLVIPIPSSTPEINFTCAINGTTYAFHMLWNDRDNSYYMDLSQPDNTPIFNGARCVLHAFLGRTANQPPVSQGVFMVIDTSGDYLECGIDDMGGRCQLVFIPQTDLLAFARPRTT